MRRRGSLRRIPATSRRASKASTSPAIKPGSQGGAALPVPQAPSTTDRLRAGGAGGRQLPLVGPGRPAGAQGGRSEPANAQADQGRIGSCGQRRFPMAPGAPQPAEAPRTAAGAHGGTAEPGTACDAACGCRRARPCLGWTWPTILPDAPSTMRIPMPGRSTGGFGVAHMQASRTRMHARPAQAGPVPAPRRQLCAKPPAPTDDRARPRVPLSLLPSPPPAAR